MDYLAETMFDLTRMNDFDEIVQETKKMDGGHNMIYRMMPRGNTRREKQKKVEFYTSDYLGYIRDAETGELYK